MQRGTMKGSLFRRKNRHGWYGKFMLGEKQVLRRLSDNEDDAREKLKKIVDTINQNVNEIKWADLIKLIDHLGIK